ncbi:hypothetical protein FJT64_027638 [Amphibalanus amphitrite]|uniref:Chitin-binding type-4 domain-containing protein n=1 Tax=Amphibalanus amphitrite TaxID=1232801 RepID=A0A6A4VXU2_AMPAM|nr:uncharacterized protein LOC122371294 [Amphibalanus amphitrite]KAF0299686.1 hypothetical protein FJT64_027638 [Amphibalanus amphitrite]
MIPVLLLVSLVGHVAGHGRLMDPPARNAMWRFNFSNPVNYNDNELFCGGFVVQYQQNDGKCGVCGDNYALDEPRPHEAGGEFAKGLIGKRYSPGQLIDIEVELTANHMGNFVIRLCPHNNDRKTVTQECLNKHVLRVAGTNSIRYVIPEDSGKAGIFRWKVELPPYLTCTQCVMQWTYYAGNTWGTCSDGEQAVGCGPQETFINCADIAIVSNTPYFGPVHNSLDRTLPLTKSEVARVVQEDLDNEPRAPAFRPQICLPHGEFKQEEGADRFCLRCMVNPEACPTDRCMCVTECEAQGEFAKRPQADLFCHENCLGFPSHCPEDKCRCF